MGEDEGQGEGLDALAAINDRFSERFENRASGFWFLDNLEHERFERTRFQSGQMHEDFGEDGAGREEFQEVAPEGDASLHVPGFEFDVVGGFNDLGVLIFGQVGQAMQANEFSGAFDELVDKKWPTHRPRDDHHPLLSLFNTAPAGGEDPQHLAPPSVWIADIGDLGVGRDFSFEAVLINRPNLGGGCAGELFQGFLGKDFFSAHAIEETHLLE